jgi:hypothetical protein
MVLLSGSQVLRARLHGTNTRPDASQSVTRISRRGASPGLNWNCEPGRSHAKMQESVPTSFIGFQLGDN